ncbi:MAG: hypothetical protein ABSG31_07185, partial [Tepidisphaeraceae bacterium]
VQADENRYIAHNPLLPDETLVNKKSGLSLQQRTFIFIPISSSNAKGAAFWETFLMPARCRRERRRASQWCSQR